MRKPTLIFIAIIAVSGLFLVAGNNPENCWWMPKCPFHLLTGLSCPSCGNTRALHALLHGRLADALAYNAMAPVLVGLFLAIAWLVLVRRRPLTYSPLKWLAYAYLAIYLAWWLLRNLLGL